MAFVRVRAASGPRHEFDVAEAELAATPSAYEVLDATPVPAARPIVYVEADAPAEPSKKTRETKPRKAPPSDPPDPATE